MKTYIFVFSLFLGMISMPSIAFAASNQSEEDYHKSMVAYQKAQAADVDAAIAYQKQNAIRELVFAGVLAVLFIFFLVPIMRIVRQSKKDSEAVLANAIQIRKAVEEIRNILKEKKT